MKVLRAIGAFFAKIGRWIANTAWVQPLLIVGGIFAVIFSIPYIKSAIEKAAANGADEDYEFYEEHALDLEPDKNDVVEADVMLDYLEHGKHDDIKAKFGSKFFLSFVKEDCANCKECVSGYEYVEDKDKKDVTIEGFKLYTILVDKMDEDEEDYLAKPIMKEHNDLFNNLATAYAENDDYVLYKNLPDQRADMQKKIESLPEATNKDGEGIDTPITFMYDYDVAKTRFNYNRISAIFFNYVDFISSDEEVNGFTKAKVIADCWNYEGVFDPDYENKK